eukprot:SAG25_NODE_302_length_10160_cov_3.981413_10_plen_56_part_00
MCARRQLSTSLGAPLRAGSHDDPALAGLSNNERKKKLKARERKKVWEANMVEWEA